MRRPIAVLTAVALAGAGVLSAAASGHTAGVVGPADVSVRFRPVASGLSSPVQVASARDGSRRLYVVEQGGRVRIVRDGTVARRAYLDISGRVVSGGEQGLLGLAFHPRFARKHFVYVAYTRASDGALQVSRFTATSKTARSVAASTERRIITVPHPGESNHNGGALVFGNKGRLYISTGDGGGGGDPYDNARDLTSLSGKILRLDVDHRCGSHNYCIPAGNPFANASNANRRTVYDWGLRNPWRMSVDRGDGRLWIADVGQEQWEEVNHVGQRGGKDFGWSCREGRHSYNSSRCTIGGEPRRMTSPVTEFDHGDGRCAVIGGYAYRGPEYPFAHGLYVYNDFCGGQVYALGQRADGSYVSARVGTVSGVSGYGENDRGEIYAVSLGGTLYHVVFRRR
jgi:glucose/arabinose dehydrogenase